MKIKGRIELTNMGGNNARASFVAKNVHVYENYETGRAIIYSIGSEEADIFMANEMYEDVINRIAECERGE